MLHYEVGDDMGEGASRLPLNNRDVRAKSRHGIKMASQKQSEIATAIQSGRYSQMVKIVEQNVSSGGKGVEETTERAYD